jgi:hypothetical protein
MTSVCMALVFSIDSGVYGISTGFYIWLLHAQAIKERSIAQSAIAAWHCVCTEPCIDVVLISYFSVEHLCNFSGFNALPFIDLLLSMQADGRIFSCCCISRGALSAW